MLVENTGDISQASHLLTGRWGVGVGGREVGGEGWGGGGWLSGLVMTVHWSAVALCLGSSVLDPHNAVKGMENICKEIATTLCLSFCLKIERSSLTLTLLSGLICYDCATGELLKHKNEEGHEK